MNPTIRLANEVPRTIQKLILELAKEEVVPHHFLRERQLPERLRFFEKGSYGVVTSIPPFGRP